MSQPSTLSFGPTWMRPMTSKQEDSKPSSSTESPGKEGFDVHDALAHSKTIVPNDKSRRYSLSEMFQVLETMKANGDLIPQESNAPYRYSKPRNILHVAMKNTSESADTKQDDTKQEFLNQQLDALLLNGPLTQENTATSASNVSSPALDSKSLLHRISSKSLLNSIHSPQISQPQAQAQAPPPPGLFFVPPDSISWYYLDPSNQEQGPFNGPLMQSWYSQGYLSADLRIRRAEESAHYPLNLLVNRLQNSHQPFLVPLPPVNQAPNIQPAFGPHDPLQQSTFFNSSLANDTGTPTAQGSNFFASPVQQHASGDSGLLDAGVFHSPSLGSSVAWGSTSRSNLIQPTWNGLNSSVRPMVNNPGLTGTPDFGLSDAIPSRLGNQSPFYNNSTLSVANSLTNINSLQQSTSAQSALSVDNTGSSGFVNTQSPVVDNAVPNHDLSLDQDLKASIDQDHISSLLLGSVLKDDLEKVAPSQILADPEVPKEKKSAIIDKVNSIKAEIAESDIPAAPVKPKKSASKQKKISEKKSVKQTIETPVGESVKEPVKPSPKQEKFKPLKEVTTPVIEKLVPVVSTKSKLAPWAAKATASPPKETETGKPLTLKEIQELEAAEKRKEQKLLEQQRIAQRNALINEAAAAAAASSSSSSSSPPVEKKTSFLGTAGWASAGQTKNNIPARTLLDIQKEEAAKKSNVAAAAARNASSFASITEKAPKEDNSWTVVASNAVKKPVVAKTTFKVSAPASKVANPAHLRTVSAQPVSSSTVLSSTGSGAGASNSGSKQRREFLAWCRAELRDLNRGVNREELLRMFFMFPCSNDSRDLIQDTIYSSSKTIHGRRFADEFIKRRRAIEKYVSNWDDALNMDPDDEDEDEWIVTTSKKKGRR